MDKRDRVRAVYLHACLCYANQEGGKTAAAISTLLAAADVEEDDETFEDRINHLMEARKLLPNEWEKGV